MAADIFPGNSPDDLEGMKSKLAVHFDNDGLYWHLYPYFESAKLPSIFELVDLYGNSLIEEYEMTRLRQCLLAAKNDLSWRPDSWEMVTGWTGEECRPEAEIKKTVTKAALISKIDALVALIDYCLTGKQKLCVMGD